MIESVFISRNLEFTQDIQKYCNLRGILLTSKSLIEFEALEFTVPKEKYDVIFFNSPKSVEFFLKKHVPTQQIIACMGQGTRKKLLEFNLIPEFVGNSSSNPNSVFSQFKLWVGSKKVLVPTGNLSRHLIKNFVRNEQLIFSEIYKTTHHKIRLPFFDVYIFSSPSNLDSFFEANNSIPKNARIISWGKSTSAAIERRKLAPHFELINSSQKEIINILSKL